MSMSAGKYKRLAHKSLTGSMAVWLSGIVFLVLCHGQTANTMDSCPLVRLGAHCDKADKEKYSEKVEKQSSEQATDCCAFIPTFFDKTRTGYSNQQVALAASTTPAIKPRIAGVISNFTPAYQYLSTVLPKNNTFLKNRTFRI